MPELRETRNIMGRPALIFGRDYSRRVVSQCRYCRVFCSVCSEKGKCCLKSPEATSFPVETTTTTTTLYPDTDTPDTDY